MRMLTYMFVAAAALTAQDRAAQTPAPAAKPPATRAAKAPAVSQIPKDAVETSPGFYKWTDAKGKVWILRRTPFGLTRKPYVAEIEKHDVAAEATTAKAQGDSIRFERVSPFGKRVWVRKKSELTESERAIWTAQQQSAASPQAAEKE